MDFWFEKSTPPLTAKKAALKTKLKLTAGTIKKVWIFHPPGCKGLAYASIWIGGHQLYPSNQEGAYHGDGVPMEFPDNYELEEPAKLTLKTWNLDDTYPHEVHIHITVLREKLDPLQQALVDLVAILKRMLGVKS